jgi:hypothetical protein
MPYPRSIRPWSSSEYFGNRERRLYLVSDELVGHLSLGRGSFGHPSWRNVVCFCWESGDGFFLITRTQRLTATCAPAVFGTPFLKRVVVPVEMRVLRILVLCL